MSCLGSIIASLVLAMLMGLVPAGIRQARAQSACPSNAPQLIIYHAGSLTAAFTAVEQVFTQQTGVCVTDVSGGSIDAARRVTAGGEPCDIYASADYMEIDRLLRPAGYADFDLLFGQGSMVLAYTTNSKNADTIAKSGETFAPPDSIPEVADNWYTQLSQPGVWVGGTNPFLDPGGYRADLIFQLAELAYGVPNLYDTLSQHFAINKSNDVLGQTYDYGFSYEHNALAAYKANPGTYRFARLPAAVGLSDPKLNRFYAKAALVVPGLRTPVSAPFVKLQGSRVIWGLTILKTAPHPHLAAKFLRLLFSEQGVALQAATGPTPISPPRVSGSDFGNLPELLRSNVDVD